MRSCRAQFPKAIFERLSGAQRILSSFVQFSRRTRQWLSLHALETKQKRKKRKRKEIKRGSTGSRDARQPESALHPLFWVERVGGVEGRGWLPLERAVTYYSTVDGV